MSVRYGTLAVGNFVTEWVIIEEAMMGKHFFAKSDIEWK